MYRMRFLCAPEDSGASGGAPAVTPVPDGSVPAAAPSLADVLAAVTAIGDRVSRNHTEFVDYRREVRSKVAGAPAATPAPTGTTTAPQAPAVWTATDQLAFRDAIEEAGIAVTVPQRKVLEKLFRADGSIADPTGWVKEQIGVLGWAARPAATAAPVVPAAPVAASATRTPDSGAPAGNSAGDTVIPDDPRLIPPSVIAQMTPAQIREHMQRWVKKSGGFVHPFADHNERAKKAGQDLSALSGAIQELARRK